MLLPRGSRNLNTMLWIKQPDQHIKSAPAVFEQTVAGWSSNCHLAFTSLFTTNIQCPTGSVTGLQAAWANRKESAGQSGWFGPEPLGAADERLRREESRVRWSRSCSAIQCGSVRPPRFFILLPPLQTLTTSAMQGLKGTGFKYDVPPLSNHHVPPLSNLFYPLLSPTIMSPSKSHHYVPLLSSHFQDHSHPFTAAQRMLTHAPVFKHRSEGITGISVCQCSLEGCDGHPRLT